MLLQEQWESLATQQDGEATVDDRVVRNLWRSYFQLPLDELPPRPQVWQRVKAILLHGSLAELFDMLELLVQEWSGHDTGSTQKLVARCTWAINSVFEAHRVSYRLINHQITPIDTPAEITAVDTALATVYSHHRARQALQHAVTLLEDHTAEQYQQCITASITAVEAIVACVTKAPTLSEGLQILHTRGVVIPDPVQQAWMHTNERPLAHHDHRLANDTDLVATQALAKYTLVTCASLVSYILDTANAQGLLTETNPCCNTPNHDQAFDQS